MSKMKDMAMTIEELRSAAAAINDAADWLTQQFSGNADEPKTEPKKEPELKLEDVRAVLADMSRKGHTAEIRALLQKYGAAKLSGVDPANYKALLKDVEGLDHYQVNQPVCPEHARLPEIHPRAEGQKHPRLL